MLAPIFMCTFMSILNPADFFEADAEFTSVVIVLGEDAGGVERRVAELLARRISEPGAAQARVVSDVRDAGNTDELRILLGRPGDHAEIRTWFDKLRIPPLTGLAPGPEGYLVRTAQDEAGHTLVLAAGIDNRGVLYAAGEILRQMVIGAWSVQFPSSIEVRTAPAFEIRGTQFGQSHVARDVAGVRPWTEEETQRAILDYALAGANTFLVGRSAGPDDPIYEFLRSFDLKSMVHYGPNVGSGPPEWHAAESIGRLGYLCPSVPAARAALLERCENAFRNSAPVDYIRFVGGDGGGCECDRCDPYGAVFIRLCEDMAHIIRKYHPDTEFFYTNQKFDNADDIAIFEYLQEEPREWLRGICYGPGSDAMSWQPGHRQTHRMDLFRYPGFGPYDRYLKEILHQLPPRHDIVFYNENTHWRYSQNGYVQMYPRTDRDGNHPPHWNHFLYERRPDQALTQVYDRLTFYAWPHYYHWVFGETVRYGIGDVTHSSGHHDHFNQWMWQRLLWAPQTRVEDVVLAYARTWFGPDAAPFMAKALFQLEENLEEIPGMPLAEKEGIDRYYQLVREAGWRIPEHHMERHWLWREYMQKAMLDKYIQLDVRQQAAVQARIEAHVAQAQRGGAVPDEALDEALDWLDALGETPEMERLRIEAELLGDESNELYGVRSEGLARLVGRDYIGLGWLRRQLERARAATGAERDELLRMIVAYEDPGEGGFYDNLGTFNPAPNAVFGYPYDHGQPYVPQMLDEGNRPSQRSMHFTQDEDQGVTLRYRGLDPAARYKIRFTFVRPWFQERYEFRMVQKSQNIYADNILLAEEFELPLRMSDFFTFDIPPEAIQDGELEIRLEKSSDLKWESRVECEQWRNSGGWGTLVSEAWLIKAD